MYFPANVTSLIQPMDQGAIVLFKRCYRKLFLQELLLKVEDEPLVTRICSVTIKNAIYWAAEAWRNSIQRPNLKRVWSQLLNFEEDDQSTLENETATILDMLWNIPGGKLSKTMM